MLRLPDPEKADNRHGNWTRPSVDVICGQCQLSALFWNCVHKLTDAAIMRIIAASKLSALFWSRLEFTTQLSPNYPLIEFYINGV